MTNKLRFKKIVGHIITSLFMLSLLSTGVFSAISFLNKSYAATTSDTSVLSVELINNWIEPT